MTGQVVPTVTRSRLFRLSSPGRTSLNKLTLNSSVCFQFITASVSCKNENELTFKRLNVYLSRFKTHANSSIKLLIRDSSVRTGYIYTQITFKIYLFVSKIDKDFCKRKNIHIVSNRPTLYYRYAFVETGPGKPRQGAVAVHMDLLVVLGLFDPCKIYVLQKILRQLYSICKPHLSETVSNWCASSYACVNDRYRPCRYTCISIYWYIQ